VENTGAVLINKGNEYIISTGSNTKTVEVGHISEGLGFGCNLINPKHLEVTTRSSAVGTYQEADNTRHTTTLAHSINSKLHMATGTANVDLMVHTSDGDQFTGSEGLITLSDRNDDEKDDIPINSPYYEPNIPC
jgi:hypothetical protein